MSTHFVAMTVNLIIREHRITKNVKSRDKNYENKL